MERGAATWRVWAARIGVGLVGAAALFLLWSTRDAGEKGALPRGATVQAVGGMGGAPPSALPRDGEAAVREEPKARFDHWRKDRSERARARRAADETRARIRASRHMRNAAGTSAAAPPAHGQANGMPSMPPLEGSGNQVDKPLGEYVRGIVRDQFIPMGRSCYEELLERSPRAGGKLVLNVVVAGETGLGGVVDDVTVQDSTIDDEALVSCLRESMYAVEFGAPPPGQERVDFTYPLLLSPNGPDGGRPP